MTGMETKDDTGFEEARAFGFGVFVFVAATASDFSRSGNTSSRAKTRIFLVRTCICPVHPGVFDYTGGP